MPGTGHRPPGEHRAGLARAGRLQRGTPAGRSNGRTHGARARLRRRPGRNRALARADARHRGRGPHRPHDHARGRRATAGRAGRGREARAAVSGGLRRARFRAHRRQRRDERGRQRRDPLRHDARLGAGTRGGARRRHGDLLDEPHDQEQRGLRPEAAVHRQRGHARNRHAPGAATARDAAQHPDGAGRLREFLGRHVAAQAHGRVAGRLAVRVRGDVERVLPAGHDAARRRARRRCRRTIRTTC